ncbi:MAG: hypothetical protein E6470_12940 [Enterobacteriaceae bacterium]|nr:hypothetical protein [Enterobacteriaceae bacterium]
MALSLTGATGYRCLRESSPDKALCAAAGVTGYRYLRADYPNGPP